MRVDPAEESRFWSRQLLEHALFLHLGIESPQARARALALHKAWQGVIADSERLGYAKTLPRTLELARDLRKLETDVMDALATGRWLGWLFPSFVEHIRREGDYFIARASGATMLPQAELQTWLHFMADHAGFAAHYLDPTEKALVAEALKSCGELRALERGCGAGMTGQLLDLSERAGKGLDAYLARSGIGTASAKSVVHSVLASHVIREGQRFLKTLQAMRAPAVRSAG